MRILISPAHYLFSDKYGSEPLWACKLIEYISLQDVVLDVVVGLNDTDIKFPKNVNIYPVFSKRSDNVLIEAIKYLSFPVLASIKSATLLFSKKYEVVHHMFPLSRWSVDPLMIFLAVLPSHPLLVLGPLQMSQTSFNDNDVSVMLVGKTKNRLISSIVWRIFQTLMSLSSYISKFMFEHADIVVFNSLASKNFYQKLFHPRTQAVIYNGIDKVNIRGCIKNKQAGAKINIVCVGHLTKRKGQIYLLKAFKKLKQDFPEVKLILVGDGEEKDNYLDFVNKNNLSQNVVFTGRVQHEDIGKIYRNSTIFCLPSISDPSPTVVLEAMSYGLPVAATNVGSVKEMVGGAGIIVNPKQEDKLYKALEKIIEDVSLRQKMSELAYQRIRNVYLWESIAKEWIKLYENLGSNH